MISARAPRRFLPVLLLWLGACRGDGGRPLFQLLSPDDTGIRFANTITTSDSVNVQTDVYIYNGAGVAAGDIDNDGLPDLFFSGNMVSSRLYLNKGEMRFEDVTDRAGVGTTRWATGATMVDINDDGLLDIYVSVSGPPWSRGPDRANLLFVNNGDRTFTEAAAQYGLADTSFTTHAAFLDYDGDRCLDLFLLNNSPADFARGSVSRQPAGMRGEAPGGNNELYRNDCHGAFVNVSGQAGVLRDAGYGLGVAVSDLNRDGRPDIYVSNDVVPNDVVYANNGNGTFTNESGRWLKHASFAGMGVDIADFNDDGWPDILQVDMMPRDLSRRKRVSGFGTYGSMLDSRSRGVRDDYSVNTLQLSNGVTSAGDLVFSDVARMAGVSHTDWSWSALFADFDNDGRKDIFIGNGYPKAVNDLDYLTTGFAARRRGDTATARRLLEQLPSYAESNYVFRNNGDLTFADRSKEWGLGQPSFSYGAAYVDLDNDGRLDLVVNNIDAPAFVYHNVGPRDEAHHYLQIRLDGVPPNRNGIGAQLTLTVGGRKQYLYNSPYRGFMSTVDGRAHFGLGAASRADSLEVLWPDGRRQMLTALEADRLVVVRQAEAIPDESGPAPAASLATPASRAFEPVGSRLVPAYQHRVGTQVDYNVQPLLPYLVSRHGPVLAVGDVNGDRLDDIFVGGSPNVARGMFLQRPDGSFAASTEKQPWTDEEAFDDWGALLFDANGDGLLDLYVASGGYQVAPTSRLLQDRLYINRGNGRFERDPGGLPTMLTSTATVRAGDFDGDGRPDLFVGGRLTPRDYPTPTRSYVLRNHGGRFVDVTAEVAPELVRSGGMITDAVWVDFDGDRKLDLVTVGEWMPIQFFRNEGRRFVNVTGATRLPSMRGWWYSLTVADFDDDGRPDLVAGNLGLNHTYTTSRDRPFGVYAGDFTGRRTTDVVLTQRIDGAEYSLGGMVPLGREIYTLSVRYPTHGSFADAPLAQLFTPRQLEHARHYEVDTFASVFLHNDGGGVFSASPLSPLAQIAPVRGAVPIDADGDGHLDLIVAGNLFDVEPNTPPADAGNGLWLRGDGHGHFTPVPPVESGFLAPKNVSGLALVNTPRGKRIIVANTGDSLQAFAVRGR